MFERFAGGLKVRASFVADGAVALSHARTTEQEVCLAGAFAFGTGRFEGVARRFGGRFAIPVRTAQNLPRMGKLAGRLSRAGIGWRSRDPGDGEGGGAEKENGHLPPRSWPERPGSRRQIRRRIGAHNVAPWQTWTRLPCRSAGLLTNPRSGVKPKQAGYSFTDRFCRARFQQSE
jgi:hypothetical protein